MNEETGIGKLIHDGLVERQEFQRRVFQNWINGRLKNFPDSVQVNDLFKDLRDGTTLLKLLEVLTGRKLKPVKGNMRLHHVNNHNNALNVLREYNVKLIGIHANSLVDGDQLTTMGLCWNIMYRFQIVEAMKGDNSKNAEKALLDWCQYILKSFPGIEIKSFQPNKWKDGYALNGIIHSFQPSLFNMNDLSKMGDAARLENAIYHAKHTFGVEPVFQPEDMINDLVDSKSFVIYISQLYMVLSSPTPSSKHDETLSKVEKAILDELQFLSSKHDSTLLQALQNPTLKDLKKRYRNYNVFFKELEAATERINSVKVDYECIMQSNNVTSEDKENVTLSFEKLINTYKTLQSNAQVARNAVQSKLVSHLIEQFDQVFEVIKQVKHDHDNISKTLNDEHSLFSEVQEKNVLCEKTIAVLSEMKPLVKSLNDLCEQLSRDQSINEPVKKKLHMAGNNVQNEFETLIVSLQKLLERSRKVLDEKKFKDKMKNWLSGIQSLQIWLKQSLQLKIDFNSEQLDYELNKIKACLSDVDLKWSEFLKLTTDWNETLCDIVKNNDYAVMQEDVQKDFADLHKMLIHSNNQCEMMISENLIKNQSNILQEWKSFFNPKYEEINLLENNLVKHPMEMDIKSAKHRKQDIKEYENKISSYVKEIELLKEKKLHIIKQKGFSVEIESTIEKDIEIVQNLLLNIKVAVKEFNKLFLDDYQKLKKRENNLFGNFVKKYEIILLWIQDNEANIEKFMSMENIFDCSKEVLSLLEEIMKYHEKIESILNEGNQALKSNCFGKSKSEKVNLQMSSLAKNWDKLADSVSLLEQKYISAMNEKSHLSSFKNKTDTLMCYVEEKIQIFHQIGKEADPKIALTCLENLIAELKENDSEFKRVYVDLDATLKNNNFSKTFLLLANTELSSVDKSWQTLCEEVQNAIIRLKAICERESDLEKQTMKGWSKMAHFISEWLEHAEILLETYSQLPNDLESLTNTMQKFEEVLINLTTEEKTVDEQLDYGELLIQNKSFKQSNINEMTDSINSFKTRKQSVKKKIQCLQSRIKELLEELQAIENAEFTSWVQQAKIVKQKLEEFDTKEKEVQTISDATKAADVQKEILFRLSSCEADMNALFIYGNALLKNKKLGEEKSFALNKETNEIKEHWDELNKTLSTINANYEKKLQLLHLQVNNKVISLVDKLNASCSWLDFVKAQVDNLISRRANKVSVLLSQEHALKKHFSDLDSKANEFEAIVKLADGVLKEITANNLNDQEVEQHLHQFKGKWSNLVDQLDSQFRSLYDEINSLLDDKKGQILKMLHLLKDNLNETQLNNNKQNIKRSINKIEELVLELSKLEKPVLKLFEHNASLNEVSMITGNEKLVLMQSCDDLLKEYKDCVHLFNEAKKNQQNGVLQFVTKETDSVINRLNKLNEMQNLLNEGLQNKNLKQYYSTCQNWLSEIEKQKEKLEELDGFINEICHFLPNGTKQIIDSAFQNLDHSKTVYEKVFERFNVLMLQLISQRLQLSGTGIQEITEEAANLEKKEFIRFEDTAGLLISLKNVVYKGDQIKFELDLITDQLNELKECGVLDALEYQKMTQRKRELSNGMQLLSSKFFIQKEKYLSFINNLVLKKLDDFSAWLPIMKKQSYENIKINASDITVLKNQLNEMKEIEQQIDENSFNSILFNKDVSINDVLNESLINQVNFAVEEWNFVQQWANKRKELLLYGFQKWEEFMQCKKDLLDYLQENEKDLLLWNQLDLNDSSNVEAKLNMLENITNAMQRRREHVINFNKVADDLLVIIGDDMNEINSVLSQVADVHDFWNRMVKNSIGYSKKLQKSRQMVIELEQGINVVDTWLTLTSSLLEIVTENLEIAQLEAILIEIKEKDCERNKIKECLESVSDWYAQLDGNDDTRSHFSVRKSVKELDEEYTDVIEKINNLNNLKGKGKLLWYRLKGNFNSTNDSNPIGSTKESGTTMFGRLVERTVSLFKTEKKVTPVTEE
ncbi:interaptin isoform X4 [Hydra vulgaris]|uniref:Interaptin isoform X4 n=1 Tax=Hydra vulgaris TaxID=6087 RepID=A0ABM4BJD6_HYDVU